MVVVMLDSHTHTFLQLIHVNDNSCGLIKSGDFIKTSFNAFEGSLTLLMCLFCVCYTIM